MPAAKELPPRLVWARRDVTLGTCPRSLVTAESEALVEEFFVQRRLGGLRLGELSARQVEAFVLLEGALAREVREGEGGGRRR